MNCDSFACELHLQWTWGISTFNRSEEAAFNPFDTSADDDILNVSSLS